MSPSDWYYVATSLAYENVEDAMEMLWMHREDKMAQKVMRILELYEERYDEKILMDALEIIQRYMGILQEKTRAKSNVVYSDEVRLQDECILVNQCEEVQ